MKKKDLTDEELISQFACRSVKRALPENRNNKAFWVKWNNVWKRVISLWK